MNGHSGCLSARWEDDDRIVCGACGEHLGDGSHRGVALRAILVRRPKRHGDKFCYGLRDAARIHGRSASRTTTMEGVPTIVRPDGEVRPRRWITLKDFYVYCPDLACGRGQHIRRPSP